MAKRKPASAKTGGWAYLQRAGKSSLSIPLDKPEYALIKRAAAADGRSMAQFAKLSLVTAAKTFLENIPKSA